MYGANEWTEAEQTVWNLGWKPTSTLFTTLSRTG